MLTNSKWSCYFTALNDAVCEVSDYRVRKTIFNRANRVRNKFEDALVAIQERIVPAFERRFVTAGLPALRFASAAALCAVCLFAANTNFSARADDSRVAEFTVQPLLAPVSALAPEVTDDTTYGPVIVWPEVPLANQTRLVTATQSVAQPFVYEHDPLIEQGEGYAIDGTDGLELVTYREVFINGEWTDPEPVSVSRLVEPTFKTIVLGVKGAASTGIYLIPAEGKFYSKFGARSGFGSSYHQGLDISNKTGTVVNASDTGTVIKAEFDGDYGNMVIIQHDNGDTTWYAHMRTILCEVGEYVIQGEQIGEMGTTGHTNGPHLHFEYHPEGGSAINPERVLVAELPEISIPNA
ncbi:MAG: peptidoglycan DD-metalloendopeptidase family protein [Oscillospiraceae bacterium]|jgi:murein DD-endopeptidase MepM/ murein hydrolase activator NlpD|nr:peptidoglycan DD-metalloendopeptidase family protein [Oscillospiraceae bacterium]